MAWLSNKEIIKTAEKFRFQTARAVAKIYFRKGFVDAVREISRCDGKIVTVGMGKAGHVAEKIASSLCSLGIPSCYLHPGEASHGNAGVIGERDILLAFSTSGKTREVIETVKLAKKLKIHKVVAITSHPDATIRRLADIEVNMGIIKEAGYLHVAPTTSIAVMLVIGDALAMVSAELRHFQMSDFAIRHHSGYLGKRSRHEQKKRTSKSRRVHRSRVLDN